MSDLISREEAIKALNYDILFPKKAPYDGEDIKKILQEAYDSQRANIYSIPSADILEHARAIKEYCDGRKNCDNCLFGQNMDIIHGCDLRDTIPECWNLPEGEKGGAE